MLVLLACAAWVAFRWWQAFQHVAAEKIAERAWEAGYQAERKLAAQQHANAAAYIAEFRAERRRREAAMAMQESMAATKKHLRVLNLPAMPRSVGELKKARNIAMLEFHPDLGGDNADAAEVNDAYSEILRRLGLSDPRNEGDAA